MTSATEEWTDCRKRRLNTRRRGEHLEKTNRRQPQAHKARKCCASAERVHKAQACAGATEREREQLPALWRQVDLLTPTADARRAVAAMSTAYSDAPLSTIKIDRLTDSRFLLPDRRPVSPVPRR